MKNENNNAMSAEHAIRFCLVHAKRYTQDDMLDEVQSIKCDSELAPYLQHREILTGLSLGQYSPSGLRRRVEELCDDVKYLTN